MEGKCRDGHIDDQAEDEGIQAQYQGLHKQDFSHPFWRQAGGKISCEFFSALVNLSQNRGEDIGDSDAGQQTGQSAYDDFQPVSHGSLGGFLFRPALKRIEFFLRQLHGKSISYGGDSLSGSRLNVVMHLDIGKTVCHVLIHFL